MGELGGGGYARVNNTKYYVERNTRDAKYATRRRVYALCTYTRGMASRMRRGLGDVASLLPSRQKPKNYERDMER